MAINDWQQTNLGNETELLTGFPFKSASYSANEGDIRLVRGDNVAQGQFRWEDVRRWPTSQVDGLSDYLRPDSTSLSFSRQIIVVLLNLNNRQYIVGLGGGAFARLSV